MTYVLLALVWLSIWYPLTRRRMRWEMFIYGQPLIYIHHEVTEEMRWNQLRANWKDQDVQ